jgi:hypothetical protein
MRKLKLFILNLIIRKLFKGLTENDVFKIINGELYTNNEKVHESVRDKIKDEAGQILLNPAWKMINDKISYEVEHKLVTQAITTDDLFSSKAMIYNLNLINEYLKKLNNLK